MGRFITEDPIRDSNNWYVYCNNQPLTRVDPTGLEGGALYAWENKSSAYVAAVYNNNVPEGSTDDLINGIQAVLDVGGCIPGVGEPLDALNAGISALRGDYVAAGLSAVSAIGADIVGKGGKAARAAGKALDSGEAIEKAAGKAVSGEKELHRSYIRKLVRDEVEARAPKTADGKFIDPNTLEVIEGKYDLGHKRGNEFWREKERAEKDGLSQKEFNDRMNDPDKYQIESPSSNRSHLYEMQ